MASGPLDRVKRFATELFVIVLGVMIALAAESWRTEAGDQARARRYAAALSSDLGRAHSELERFVDWASGQRSRVDSFLVLVRSGQPIPDTLHTPPMIARTPVLPLGTLEALVGTGDLHLFPNDSIWVAATIALSSARSLQAASRSIATLEEAVFYEWLEIEERIRLEESLGYDTPVPASVLRGRPDATAAFEKHIAAVTTQREMMSDLAETLAELRMMLDRDGDR